MTLLRNNNNISMEIGIITKVNGDDVPVQALAEDILYDVEIVGLDGPNITINNLSPAQRVTDDVEVVSIPIGAPVIIKTVYVGEQRSPMSTIWPIGVEKIIFDDCDKLPEEAEGSKIVAFFKKLMGIN